MLSFEKSKCALDNSKINKQTNKQIALCTWKKQRKSHNPVFCKIFETLLLLLILGGTEGNCDHLFSLFDNRWRWLLRPIWLSMVFQKKIGGWKETRMLWFSLLLLLLWRQAKMLTNFGCSKLENSTTVEHSTTYLGI